MGKRKPKMTLDLESKVQNLVNREIENRTKSILIYIITTQSLDFEKVTFSNEKHPNWSVKLPTYRCDGELLLYRTRPFSSTSKIRYYSPFIK